MLPIAIFKLLAFLYTDSVEWQGKALPLLKNGKDVPMHQPHYNPAALYFVAVSCPCVDVPLTCEVVYCTSCSCSLMLVYFVSL